MPDEYEPGIRTKIETIGKEEHESLRYLFGAAAMYNDISVYLDIRDFPIADISKFLYNERDNIVTLDVRNHHIRKIILSGCGGVGYYSEAMSKMPELKEVYMFNCGPYEINRDTEKIVKACPQLEVLCHGPYWEKGEISESKILRDAVSGRKQVLHTRLLEQYQPKPSFWEKLLFAKWW